MQREQVDYSWLIFIGLLLLISVGSSSCRTAKILAPGEYVVRKNSIALAKGSAVDDWSNLEIELLGQIQPQKNGKFFFVIPREWFWLKRRGASDTTRFQRFVQRIIAEEPAFYDTTALESSRERLQAFMMNRGYFNAEVISRTDTFRNRFIKQSFTIQPNQAYRFDTIRYKTDNPLIAALLSKNPRERLLDRDQLVDSRDYDAEVARVVALLRNNGFAYFYANSIAPLDADSTDGRINAQFEVLPPERGRQHKTYRIGKITVFPDYDPLAVSNTVMIDTSADGLRFIYEQEEMSVNTETLIENIFFRPGQLFDQSLITKTNLQLNNLGVFRLVTIKQEESLDEEGEINFYIQLSLQPKREIGGGVELSFTDRQVVTGEGQLALIGTQVNGTLSNRNVRGGAENLTLTLNAGLEFNFADLGNPDVQRLNTAELGANTTYDLPRFIDYFGLYRSLNKVKSGEDLEGNPEFFISKKFYTAIKETGKTRFQLGANYVSLLNFYQTTTLSTTFGYNVSTTPRNQYTINHTGLVYFVVNPQPAFLDILESTPFLERSLGDQLFTGFLLRNISYTNTEPNKKGSGNWGYRLDFEQSGFEMFLINKLRNEISGTDSVFSFGPDIDYARYVRGSASLSYTHNLSNTQSIALRAFAGSALTFGFNRRITDVPYVRQFFGGGNSSLRGWNARAVGPGSYIDTFSINQQNIANYQQGNFKIELNAEYRMFLTNIWTSRLEGALFVDAGNVWTWKQDESRPGSQFRLNTLRNGDNQIINEPFWQQYAMNTGAGLRLDIGYALIRVDLGIKLRNPYPIGGSYFPTNFSAGGIQRLSWAFGLNYPF